MVSHMLTCCVSEYPHQSEGGAMSSDELGFVVGEYIMGFLQGRLCCCHRIFMNHVFLRVCQLRFCYEVLEFP